MNLLLLKYLNSVKVFEAPNDQGTPPPKPEINVESVDNREDKTPVTGDPDPDDNDDGDNNEEDKDDDKEEDKDDDHENETDEQRTARVAQEKEERRQGRLQRKFDKLAARATAAENEAAELKKQLAEKPKEGLTEEEIERRAEAIADAKLKDKEKQEVANAFQKAANTLIKDASKIDKEFEVKINKVAQDTDTLMPEYMIEILSDLDNKNGSEIMALLANDEDLYEEICVLSERKMTRRLDKLSDELKGKRKDKEKEPVQQRERRIPDPIEPINDGSNNRGNCLPAKPTQNMDEFVRVRALQNEQFRKVRGR